MVSHPTRNTSPTAGVEPPRRTPPAATGVAVEPARRTPSAATGVAVEPARRTPSAATGVAVQPPPIPPRVFSGNEGGCDCQIERLIDR